MEPPESQPKERQSSPSSNERRLSRGEELTGFEGFEILEELRSDAVSHWYRARHTELDRRVWIRSLNPDVMLSSPFALALETEGRLLGRLNHPNILGLLDLKSSPSSLWMVLEDVDGSALADLLRGSERIPALGAIGLGIQLAEALSHAHGEGLVHGRLSPDCVWVGRRGAVRLSGFTYAPGQSGRPSRERNSADSEFPAPGFLSPEQILDEPLSEQSDLFALGVILYRVLSGRLPFSQTDELSTTQQIRQSEAPSLARDLDAPAELEALVLQLLEKHPQERPPSAAAVAERLHRLLAAQGSNNPEQAVSTALDQVGLGPGPAEPRGRAGRPPAQTTVVSNPPKRTVLRAGLLLASIGFLVLLGGGLIHSFGGPGPTAGATGSRALPLLPERHASVRVVATPWAKVFVDGEAYDTTPFAGAIPLTEGTHYFRFEHPNAPTERREVALVAGDSILLDVQMQVARPKKSPPKRPGEPGGPSRAKLDAGP